MLPRARVPGLRGLVRLLLGEPSTIRTGKDGALERQAPARRPPPPASGTALHFRPRTPRKLAQWPGTLMCRGPAPPRPAPFLPGAEVRPYLAGAASVGLPFHALPSRGAAGPVPGPSLTLHFHLRSWSARSARGPADGGRGREHARTPRDASPQGPPCGGSTRLQTQRPGRLQEIQL